METPLQILAAARLTTTMLTACLAAAAGRWMMMMKRRRWRWRKAVGVAVTVVVVVSVVVKMVYEFHHHRSSSNTFLPQQQQNQHQKQQQQQQQQRHSSSHPHHLAFPHTLLIQGRNSLLPPSPPLPHLHPPPAATAAHPGTPRSEPHSPSERHHRHDILPLSRGRHQSQHDNYTAAAALSSSSSSDRVRSGGSGGQVIAASAALAAVADIPPIINKGNFRHVLPVHRGHVAAAASLPDQDPGAEASGGVLKLAQGGGGGRVSVSGTLSPPPRPTPPPSASRRLSPLFPSVSGTLSPPPPPSASRRLSPPFPSVSGTLSPPPPPSAARRHTPLPPSAGSNHVNESAPFLVVLVCSKPENTEFRLAVRKTWGYQQDPRHVALRFVVGHDESWDDIIQREHALHRDVVVTDYVDSYENLSYKVLASISWVLRHARLRGARYVMKVDDDTYVDLPHLLHELTTNSVINDVTRNRQGLYSAGFVMGAVCQDSPVVRDDGDKWFVSHLDYPSDVYPTYVFGGAYVMTKSAAAAIVAASLRAEYLHLEDVWMTGILARTAGVGHVSHPGFSFWTSPRPSPCDVVSGRRVTAVNMTSKQLFVMYTGVHAILRAGNGTKC